MTKAIQYTKFYLKKKHTDDVQVECRV